jgi:hypothetical protein
MTADRMVPDIEWFDSSTSWECAVRRAVFFGGYCGGRTVVRWMPQYHLWYIGFRRPTEHPRAAVYAGIRESIRTAATR